MLSLSSVVLSLAGLAVAAPTVRPRAALQLTKFNGEKTGNYIVKLKDDVEMASVTDSMGSSVTRQWSKVFHGFAVKGDANIDDILNNENVESVEEEGIFKISVTEDNAPWGISRVSAKGKLDSTDATALNYDYTYDNVDGSVDVYVVDTGVNVDHEDFEGRAKWGTAIGDYEEQDGNGHGTHCAGTVAGKRFGVAKNANIIAVKVLSDEGSGSTSDIVDGLEWVGTNAGSNPSVVSMSLGGSASTSLDNAVESLVSSGIHVAVAAGNDGADAGDTSPARVKTAVTVGASDITDTMADFSNFGSVLDVFAPGVDVTSTWIGSDTATNTISGTSMATPHVAGLIAYFLGQDGSTSPADIVDKLQSTGQEGVLDGVPDGTANIFIHNA